jgi:quercetin dioxygenase-like cupin family protein
MKRTAALFILVAVGVAATLRADQTAITATPVLTTRTTASGQQVDVPGHPEVIVSRLEIAPNVALPLHEHPYPRYAYVLSGTLEVNVAGGTANQYKPGDFIVEVIGQCHSGRAIGGTPVQLLVIDQVVPGDSNTVPCRGNAAGKSPHP